MNIVLWVIAGFLAITFLAAGGMKATASAEKLHGMLAWTKSFPLNQVRLIGLAEVLGAIGLVLPPLVGVAEILTPIAALALAVMMAGAVATHIRLREGFALWAPAATLGVLALIVAVLRFGAYSF